ncbi:hypothetical protein DFH06DRAFT_610975 [Mycena polygramma]|nr:hypothetical protein DFH06DRAFT_610975 [Mycena polygramma]
MPRVSTWCSRDARAARYRLTVDGGRRERSPHETGPRPSSSSFKTASHYSYQAPFLVWASRLGVLFCSLLRSLVDDALTHGELATHLKCESMGRAFTTLVGLMNAGYTAPLLYSVCYDQDIHQACKTKDGERRERSPHEPGPRPSFKLFKPLQAPAVSIFLANPSHLPSSPRSGRRFPLASPLSSLGSRKSLHVTRHVIRFVSPPFSRRRPTDSDPQQRRPTSPALPEERSPCPYFWFHSAFLGPVRRIATPIVGCDATGGN